MKNRYFWSIAAIVAAIAAAWLYYGLQRKVDLEVGRQLNPNLPQLALKVRSVQDPFYATDPNILWFTDASQVSDFALLPQGGLLVGQGGLALFEKERPARFAGRTTGLPFTSFFRIFQIDDGWTAVGAEGWVRFDVDPLLTPRANAWAFADNRPARILAADSDSNRLFLLTDKGELASVEQNIAHKLCPVAVKKPTCLAHLEGRFLVGTREDGLFLVSPYGNRCKEEPIGLPQGAGSIRFCQTFDKEVWIGADDGLFSFDGLEVVERFKGGMVTDATRESNRTWFGTFDGAVFELGEEKAVAVFSAPVLSMDVEESILRIGTGQGLFSLDTNDSKATPTSLVSKSDLAIAPERYITALAFDGRDLLAGGLNTGIVKIDTGTKIASNFGPTIAGVSSIQRNAGSGWVVGGADGLYELSETGDLENKTGKKEGLIHQNVTFAIADAKGIYAATGAGLSRMEAGGIRSINAFHGLVNNHLYALASDEQGVWVGTLGGLCRVQADGLLVRSCLTEKDGLPHPWVTALVQKGEDLFVGTYGGGVVKIDREGSVSRLSGHQDASINLNAATAAKDMICFGSLENGVLCTRDGKKLERFDGYLPTRNVTALSYENGRLAVGTDIGVCVIGVDIFFEKW